MALTRGEQDRPSHGGGRDNPRMTYDQDRDRTPVATGSSPRQVRVAPAGADKADVATDPFVKAGRKLGHPRRSKLGHLRVEIDPRQGAEGRATAVEKAESVGRGLKRRWSL